MDKTSPSETAGFGGGCHWCTEGVFEAVRGVSRVEQGFIAAQPPDDAFSEAVRVTFDPRVAALEDLIAIHLATHSSASNHALRGKYRSAVYVVDPAQADRANAVLEAARRTLARPPVTRVLPLEAFRPSPERFQHYARRNAGKPFCRTYIDPKLNVLREEFPRLAADS
jgi:peptide-methionine (S)-S-oxide reductase